jgi:hypothetical protein
MGAKNGAPRVAGPEGLSSFWGHAQVAFRVSQ